MRITLLAVFIACFGSLTAQPADSVRAALHRILPLFKYRQELNNCQFLPGGLFVAGRRKGTDSVTLGSPAEKRVESFLLAKFEVRNKDYRKFIDYVRDSLGHTLLGHFIHAGNTQKIDWDAEINWNDDRIEPLLLSPDDRLFGKKEIDVSKIIYKNSAGRPVAIYPDTLCWIRDFAYSYNEPITSRYLRHPVFGNYPVVGINQLQAMAYCDWKTRQWNAALQSLDETAWRFMIRLPTSDEWEYAAQADYPLVLTDSAQKKFHQSWMNDEEFLNYGFKYNFGRYTNEAGLEMKSYIHDGFFYTAPADTYQPNKNGLFNLIGNVAEWTSSSGSYRPEFNTEGKNEELADLRKKFPNSPFSKMNEKEIDSNLQKLVIVKGGSWATDDSFYLQPGANQYFLPDISGHSYLGFRIAVTLIRKAE